MGLRTEKIFCTKKLKDGTIKRYGPYGPYQYYYYSEKGKRKKIYIGKQLTQEKTLKLKEKGLKI